MKGLYDILAWAKRNGEVRAVERIRLYTLAASIKEQIQLSKVTPQTTCSKEYLELVRKVASEVVGKPCPL